ncbi:TIGR02281 family clan AA aspartic protease [Ollibium composti]|uniref:TIGR02281 family clan AA aspartic protease n=1 Tax=Ollibium composti TaxID=2675109 RepID=A0ABY2QCX5_9HYPH|nr:TIGR02281 family clan AA aspartic protease [Mesorhizobium composti]THF60118.1 TIGR02281 family clan AA aspartic protease [Mesorhizobium composti]
MSRSLWLILGVIGFALILLILNNSAGSTFGIENNDFSQLVWLGLFALVIGAGLLRSGQRLSELARNLGAWAVVVLALVAGYQYRYELQDFASRVTAGLVPGSPLALGEEDGRATVTLEKGPNGHFQARVSINGQSIMAVVDTGATSTVLTADDAVTAGFNPAALSYVIPVATANGMANAATVHVGELAIGNIVRRNMTVLVAAPGSLSQSLLGMNFIGSLAGFDVRGDRMILRD